MLYGFARCPAKYLGQSDDWTSNSAPADSYEISEQLLALHNHVVEAHQCSECRQLLHKLANSIHVALFDTKLVKKKAKSLPPFRRRFSPR